MRIRLVILIVLLSLVSAVASAQQPTAVASDEVNDLKALVYVLQDRLAKVEKELGQEKARRAELELSELQRARETLDPAVKRRLGLPVPEAPKTEQKPVTPQTPPK